MFAVIDDLGLDLIAAHESRLLTDATAAILAVPGIRLIGTARRKASVLSFVMDGVHPHDIGTIVDSEGVAIRTGHHCAQPLHRELGLLATTRASFGIYTRRDEIDALVEGIAAARKVFAP